MKIWPFPSHVIVKIKSMNRSVSYTQDDECAPEAALGQGQEKQNIELSLTGRDFSYYR